MTHNPMLSRADYDALVDELASLRDAHRASFAEDLRHARAFGSLGDEDDRLAALEDATIDRSRIAHLERMLETATVVDEPAPDGDVVGLGSVVRVRRADGREVEYELVGRRQDGNGARPQVTPGSPVGEALLGARCGDLVRITLPNETVRELTIVSVA
ncbi:MAG TPA: GreA/GreB family elongation factor [Solirubrobacter sp.]|nr:GreA/GreB family elongation factor [Solirubrobacter sp.]